MSYSYPDSCVTYYASSSPIESLVEEYGAFLERLSVKEKAYISASIYYAISNDLNLADVFLDPDYEYLRPILTTLDQATVEDCVKLTIAIANQIDNSMRIAAGGR